MSLAMTIRDRRFAPLFWTQFLGALNDNVFKNALVLIITYREVAILGMGKGSIVALAGGLFIFPFLAFSHIAGQLADKLEKSRLVRITKYWEVAIMVVAALGFYLHQFGMLLIVLFLAGVQAAFFGPVKYSILPELVSPTRLVDANAYVEGGTFLAILLGTICGGLLSGMEEIWIISTLLGLAIMGVITSWGVPRVAGGAPGLEVRCRPLPNFVQLHAILARSKAVYNSVLGISWFWFFGAAMLSILPVYCKDMLHVDERVVTAFLAMFTVGIGVGSVVCGRLSFGRVEVGLVPIGSFGMTLFLLDLFWARPDWPTDGTPLGLTAFLASSVGPRLLFDFFMACFFGGLFILPLYTLIQERSRPEERSRVVAANNIMNSVFMVVSSGLVMAFHAWSLSFPQMFLVLAVLNLAMSAYIYSVVPEFTLRFFAWVAARLIYRIRVRGADQIPSAGPALLVCNHVSYVDWLIIMALVRRPVRFVMHQKFWGVPVIKTLMKQAGVIPIAGRKDNSEVMERAFEQISASLGSGALVCIFPEGHITRDGVLHPFRRGLERALAADPVPVVPMALRGLWGTWFSFSEGRALRKRPRHWLAPIELVIGPAEPPGSTAALLETKVRALLEGS